MPIEPKSFIRGLLREHQRQKFSMAPSHIRLKDLFSDARDSAGNLILKDIPFTLLGPTLNYLDFSGCVIEGCDFKHLIIQRCIFDSSLRLEDKQFESVKFIPNDQKFQFADETDVAWLAHVKSLKYLEYFLQYSLLDCWSYQFVTKLDFFILVIFYLIKIIKSLRII